MTPGLIKKAEAMDLQSIERELAETLDRLERLRWRAADAPKSAAAGLNKEIKEGEAWMAVISDRYRALIQPGR